METFLQIKGDEDPPKTYEYWKRIAKEQNVLLKFNDDTKTIWLSGTIQLG